MSVRQSKEWELFDKENPIPEEQIIVQIAIVASTFANCFIKRKDGKGWKIDDFIPKFGEKKKTKDISKNIKSQILGVIGSIGDEKAKKWAKKRTKQSNDNMVKGTDGKMYKYALEEFAKKNKKPPKRLR